jgi:hypothetical protein
MAAYRKKYASLENDEPVTTAENVAAAKLPGPVEDPKPIIEPAPTSDNPVDKAAQSAIKQRMDEMEQASKMAAAPQPQPQPEPEPPRVVDGDPLEEAIRDWPERPKKWVRENPQFITDPEQSARMQYAHHIAVRETGENGTPRYYAAMESLLELPQAEPSPQPQPRAPATPSRPAGPSVSYAAPPTREAPSFSGQPVSDGRVTLTAEEVNLAKSLGLSNQDYARQKLIYRRQKQAGMHGDAG